MKQYKDLLKAIKERGVVKPAARENMPGTISLFGYQFRHDLSEGFPLLTTKKMYWKGVVVELLWFLKGDTNIKYLVDNGVNIWNEDAYQFYLKKYSIFNSEISRYTLVEFIEEVKKGGPNTTGIKGYTLGDCGFQYGKVWRSWKGESYLEREGNFMATKTVDQIANLIKGLRTNPQSRRHIVTATDPGHDTQLALYWCHSMFQFNCRPIPDADPNEPQYYLDCQLYQRSADVVLGVPFNIASYSLLIHIIARICNMIPGDFVHTFGDVHIYEDHLPAVYEQLAREERSLPTLHINCDFETLDELLDKAVWTDFRTVGYNPHPPLENETKLSTGL